MGSDHPSMWRQAFDGGRSAIGQTLESYTDPLFRRHLLDGTESADGLADGCLIAHQ